MLSYSTSMDALGLKLLEILLAYFALLRWQKLVEEAQVSAIVDRQSTINKARGFNNTYCEEVITNLDPTNEELVVVALYSLLLYRHFALLALHESVFE